MGSCYSKDNSDSVLKTPSLEEIQRPIPREQLSLPTNPPPVPVRDPSTYSLEDIRKLIANRNQNKNDQTDRAPDSRYTRLNQLSGSSLVPRSSNSDCDCIEPTHHRPKFEADQNANPAPTNSSVLKRNIQNKSAPSSSHSSTIMSSSMETSKQSGHSGSKDSACDMNYSPSSDTVFFLSSLDCPLSHAETSRARFQQKGKSKSLQTDNCRNREPLPCPRISPVPLHLLMRLQNDNDGASSSAPSTPRGLREHDDHKKKSRKPIPAPRESRSSQNSLGSMGEPSTECKTPQITPRTTKCSSPQPINRPGDNNSHNPAHAVKRNCGGVSNTVQGVLDPNSPDYIPIPNRADALNMSLPMSRRLKHPMVQRRRSKSKYDLPNATDSDSHSKPSSTPHLTRKPYYNQHHVQTIDPDRNTLEDLMATASGDHNVELEQIVQGRIRDDKSFGYSGVIPACVEEFKAYDDGYFNNLNARKKFCLERLNNNQRNSSPLVESVVSPNRHSFNVNYSA